jgi:putative transposase
LSTSRLKRKERNLWQRRFWEYLIRDEADFIQHCDYIHYNPVHHQLCRILTEWQFSSVRRFIAQEIYPPDWGNIKIEMALDESQYDL